MVQTTKNASDAIKEKDEMQAELESLRHQHSKAEEAVQQSSQDASREKSELMERMEHLQKENVSLTEKFDDLLANSSAEIAELNVKLDKIREDNEVDDGHFFSRHFVSLKCVFLFAFNRSPKTKRLKSNKIPKAWRRSTGRVKRPKEKWNKNYKTF